MEARAQFPYRFFVITFLWSWMIWLPLVLAALHIIPVGQEFLAKANFPALVLAAFGPALGALYSLVTLNGKTAVREYLLGVLDLRIGWKAWIAPIVLLGTSTCVAWILPELWGTPHLGIRSSLLASPLNLLIIALFAGSQEELGWRGYILDPLEERLRPWLGSLVLGVIWALWHLPLFFVPESGQGATPWGAFLLLTTGYSWFFSWVRHASGKRILSGIYAHALVNIFGSVFPTVGPSTPQVRYWLWAIFAFIIGFVAMAFRPATKPCLPQRLTPYDTAM
jgi:membrane protease YdiL (CAAX protease family)